MLFYIFLSIFRSVLCFLALLKNCASWLLINYSNYDVFSSERINAAAEMDGWWHYHRRRQRVTGRTIAPIWIFHNYLNCLSLWSFRKKKIKCNLPHVEALTKKWNITFNESGGRGRGSLHYPIPKPPTQVLIMFILHLCLQKLFKIWGSRKLLSPDEKDIYRKIHIFYLLNLCKFIC